MPRRAHWFPVSHDLIHDPELIELTELHGEWMLAVWLEMLSISDRNEGEIKGTPEYIAKSLTWLYHSNSRRYNSEWRRNKLRMAFEWMSNKGWIRVERDRFYVCNYPAYHKTRGANSAPPTLPSEPSEPIRSTTPSPSADSNKLDPKIKEITDLLFKAHREKFIKCRVMTWVGEAKKHHFDTESIVAALTKFQPYAGEIEHWYPYLDKLIYKINQDRSRDVHEIEHERNKKETAGLAGEMFGDAKVKERPGAYRKSMSRR